TFPEFEVALFASEPEIVKPIWLAWDERGRLWIAETVDYPNNLQPPGEGHDRLKICEDTDGDGRADKFTVFADKLSIPTGFVFANGGVIVIHSGKTEFLQDTDGDDKADERRVLFSGWGMGDTHATASNLRYGFDNWIWGTVGYSGFRGTVGGKEIRFGQGIFRFKPDGSKLEFVRSSNNNTWGLGLSEDNVIFGSTANGNASMYMPIPNRYYEAVHGWSAGVLGTIADSQRFYPLTDQVRQVDYHGRYTAGAGSALYTARKFPKEYWNRVQFVSEPTGHLLGKFHLEARGADFIAHNGRNFAASDDEWSSPVCAEVGPDGALWVSDWYNYIIQHNPTPRGFQTGKGAAYETPLRDKTHGRIYRIHYVAAPRERGPDRRSTAGLPPAELAALSRDATAGKTLVAALKNDNLFWRMTAQRLLVERGQKDVVPALCELVRDPGVDEIGLNAAAIHALWTLHGLGAFASVSSSPYPSPSGRGEDTRRAAISRDGVDPQARGESGFLSAGGVRGNAASATAATQGSSSIGAAEGPDPAAVAAAISALKHPSPGVRRAAVMVLPREDASLKAILAGKLLDDIEPQVRLAALLACSEMPASESVAAAVLTMLQEPRNSEDRWIPDAATTAAAHNDAAFLRTVLASYKPASAGPAADSPKNRLPNASFEELRDGKPVGWRTVTHSGRGEFSVGDTGRSGSRSVKISSVQGADASWSVQIPVKPRADYQLTGWIRTENLRKLGGA
ncbi:MAG TPA: PVC-type heme-binding CxxCH protein, partial [Verrucomicrobiae bacterium]|nr:PVC-type heme-binding CxxCH protein [Verrucomicrobiae bacterium]